MICNEPVAGQPPPYTASFSGVNPAISWGRGENQAKLAV